MNGSSISWPAKVVELRAGGKMKMIPRNRSRRGRVKIDLEKGNGRAAKVAALSRAGGY